MKQKVFSILALLLTAATAAMAQTYSVTVKEGTEDAADWRADPNPAANGAAVTIKYNGKRKIESVRAVRKPVLVTALTLNKVAMEMVPNSTETLSVTAVEPDNATDMTVVWSSSDPTKATVDATTGVVTAVQLSDTPVNITATATDGSGVTATCAVTIKAPVNTGDVNINGWNGGTIDGGQAK